jgi:hypothetical protein
MTREEEIKNVMAKITKLWLAEPHMRLGQLIDNSLSDSDIFFVKDEELIKTIEHYVYNSKLS